MIEPRFPSDLRPIESIVFNQGSLNLPYVGEVLKKAPQKNPRNYLPVMRRRAKELSARFKKQSVPFEVDIRDSTNQIYLDLLIADTQKVVASRDISEENFNRVMDDITTGKGLIIDSSLKRGKD